MIKRLRSEYGDNYSYIIYNSEGNEATLVDPVVPKQINRFLTTNSLKPVCVINTHGHGDHTSGNREFRSVPSVKIICHPRAKNKIDGVSRTVEDGEVLNVGGHQLKVLYTPGHTPGSICLLAEEYLLTGDTLFLAGCGNPKFGGNPRDLFHSLKNKLLKLPEHLTVYPGHDYSQKNLKFALECEPDNSKIQQKLDYVRGVKLESKEPTSTIGEEKTYNPFFRFNSPTLIKNIKGLQDEPTDWDIFKKLRERRNNW